MCPVFVVIIKNSLIKVHMLVYLFIHYLFSYLCGISSLSHGLLPGQTWLLYSAVAYLVGPIMFTFSPSFIIISLDDNHLNLFDSANLRPEIVLSHVSS